MRAVCLIVLLTPACGAGANDTSAPATDPPPQRATTNVFDDASDAHAEAASRATRAAQLTLGYLPRFLWNRSLPIDSMAPGIGALGGTELRAIVAFEGKLFASVGYWMDTQRTNPALPGAQILRLDSAQADWTVDTELTQRGPDGRKQYYAFASLERVVFTRDGDGIPLPAPMPMLLAGVWSTQPGLDAFSRRRDPDGGWRQTTLDPDAPAGSQLRAFIVHRDAVTHADLVFAGGRNAIYVGRYDASVGDVDWFATDWQGDITAAKNSALRVLSFAEANGKLYASVNGYILERQDGRAAAWRVVTYVAPNTLASEGFRGLTAIAGASGDVLMVGLEDSPARVYTIDPQSPDGNATIDMNVSAFMSDVIGTRFTYGILSYNHMTVLPDPAGACPSLLIGMELRAPDETDTFGSGPHQLDPNAHFVVRDCHGNYRARMVYDDAITPVPMLVSVRTLAVSPFADDPPGTIYAGGFDANNTKVHNSAWLYRGTPYQPTDN